MKKMIMVLTAVIVLFSAAVLAEDLSAVTDGKEPFRFVTFGEAAEAAAETADEGDIPYGVSSEGYCAALIKRNGRFFRAVTFLDGHGKELYTEYLNALDSEKGQYAEEEYRTLEAYLMTLPVQYTEELTVASLDQEELDAMAGKTLGEVMLEPWGMQMHDYPDTAEAGKDVIFRMVKGFCEYELAIDESPETYRELRAADSYAPVTGMNLNNYLDLTVRCVKYSRVSHNVLNLNYRADGSIELEDELLTEGYDYDLMVRITDRLAAAWEGGEPDREAKESMIAEMTEEHPEAADMIRQIVESFH